MKLPIGRITSLIVKGSNIRYEQKQEQRAWEMWLSLYPHMTIPQPMAQKPSVEFKPFSQFYKASIQPVTPTKSVEEILKDVDTIRAMALSPKE